MRVRFTPRNANSLRQRTSQPGARSPAPAKTTEVFHGAARPAAPSAPGAEVAAPGAEVAAPAEGAAAVPPAAPAPALAGATTGVPVRASHTKRVALSGSSSMPSRSTRQ